MCVLNGASRRRLQHFAELIAAILSLQNIFSFDRLFICLYYLNPRRLSRINILETRSIFC